MNCSLCGYSMGPLDKECARCHGKGLAPQPPRGPASPHPSVNPSVNPSVPAYGQSSQSAPPSQPASSQGDLFAAVLCIGMIVVCMAMVWHMITAIWTHEPLILTSRFGQRPVPYTPFSVTWWFFIAMGVGASSYCAYLLVQVIRKQQVK